MSFESNVKIIKHTLEPAATCIISWYEWNECQILSIGNNWNVT
jgi:hypothetical protein